jgi:phosphatidylethanolamine/phosphatidyl-N-methylethanolamine N-methyltransferase
VRDDAAAGLREKLAFLRGLIASPSGVSAVLPSSPSLARALAAPIAAGPEDAVLELGPGTGAVTEAILARGVRRLTVVEYDPDFAAAVAARFPGVLVLRGDALALGTVLGAARPAFASIISGLPLLNLPKAQRHAVIVDALARMTPGAPFIQVSYGARPAMPACALYSVCRAAFVWRNLPPAYVWIYRSRQAPSSIV